MRIIKLELTENEIAMVLAGLSRLPLGDVMDLWLRLRNVAIQSQAAEQQQAAETQAQEKVNKANGEDPDVQQLVAAR